MTRKPLTTTFFWLASCRHAFLCNFKFGWLIFLLIDWAKKHVFSLQNCLSMKYFLIFQFTMNFHCFMKLALLITKDNLIITKSVREICLPYSCILRIKLFFKYPDVIKFYFCQTIKGHKNDIVFFFSKHRRIWVVRTPPPPRKFSGFAHDKYNKIASFRFNTKAWNWCIDACKFIKAAKIEPSEGGTIHLNLI